MSGAIARRRILRLLAGAPLLAASGGLATAAESKRIAGLIAKAKGSPKIADRIDLISRGLFGAKYVADTLIGGPKQPEKFVVYDDAFDCVTYCEIVLAAALAGDMPGFESALRQIRYHNGEVAWRERNHYFSDWCARNIENKICGPVAIDTVPIVKSSNLVPELGKQQWTLDVIPQAKLLENAAVLQTGDILGFISRRANLDYAHTGFIAFGKNNGELLLRHASSTRLRVMEQPLAPFLAANRTEYVTVVRPQERPAA